MIRTTRRAALIGALAVPTVAGLATWRWRHGEASVLLHDPSLPSGRRFAERGSVRDADVRVIEGDRIRLARKVVAERPALIAGVSRHADALLIEDVAREAGYVRVVRVRGRGAACEAECRPGWQAVGRLARSAEGDWVAALADFASSPREAPALTGLPAVGLDRGLVLGWVLAPKA